MRQAPFRCVFTDDRLRAKAMRIVHEIGGVHKGQREKGGQRNGDENIRAVYESVFCKVPGA